MAAFLHPVRRAGLALVVVVTGCGTGERDRRDETGAPAADGTRIELIYVAADSSAVDSSPADSPSPTGSTGADNAGANGATPESPGVGAGMAAVPAAPTADDEVGGDDLITYAADGDYTVQVGNFTDSGNAGRRVRELVALGYPAYAVTHPEGGQVRVRVGYFATHDAADRFGQRFRRDHGGTYWVDRRASEGGGT